MSLIPFWHNFERPSPKKNVDLPKFTALTQLFSLASKIPKNYYCQNYDVLSGRVICYVSKNVCENKIEPIILILN